jgi:type VI secretion system protein ImpL
MWVFFVAAFLLAGIWVGGYFLDLPLWVEISASAGVVVLLVVYFLIRRWRSAVAARNLEKEILAQAAKQAANARPDRRPEILELQEQIKKGIASLKSSKMGGGSGSRALYALPWYMIIGPPGAGKTTALKASGLEFPFTDPRGGGGVKGVGGTRNCDWWFTNEAILLDTAGRYATQQDDNEEWLAFLAMLRKFRAKKPINGVLVAVAIPDLMGSEEQIDTMAKKLRARIDEVMTKLEMVVPVYVMFTKADLVAGFVEFWGDLRKSERGAIWGASFRLDQAGKTSAKEALEQEFDVLVQALHARAVSRIGSERQTELRPKIFGFPLEIAALKENLAEFVGALFQKNTYQETPIFRGFYFTSGTQEGRPMDRILGGMAKAFGLQQQQATVNEQPKEQKSYFVTDLLRKVVFPDQHVAGRTAREMSRRRLRTFLYATAAIGLAAGLIVPSSCTFLRNRDLVDTSEKLARDASKSVQWDDPQTLAETAGKLDPLREQVQQLDKWKTEGAPVTMRWGMYAGDALHPALRDCYAAILAEGFVKPVVKELEDQLRSLDAGSMTEPAVYNRTFGDLKTYLMLTEKDRLVEEWAAPRLTKLWAGAAHAAWSTELEKALKPHVDYYLELIKRGQVPLAKQNAKLVKSVRKTLLTVPKLDRDYEDIVRDVNFKVEGIKLDSIFYGPLADYIKPKKKVKVEGVYTKRGWQEVSSVLLDVQKQLSGERWVLGETMMEGLKTTTAEIMELQNRYFQKYTEAWKALLNDIEVTKPSTQEKSLQLLQLLAEPEWPYKRLLRLVDDNTKLDVGDAPKEDLSDELKKKGLKDLKQKAPPSGIDAGIPMPSGTTKKGGRPMSPVEITFKPLCAFAIQDPPPPEGESGPPTKLTQYQNAIDKLVRVLSEASAGGAKPPSPKEIADAYETAQKSAEGLLEGMDDASALILRPLLVRPLAQPAK